MQRLDDLVGKIVTICFIHSNQGIYDVKLHGIETGGIWVESRELEELLGYTPKKSAPRASQLKEKPVMFIPYAQIMFLIASSTELDENEFGA